MTERVGHVAVTTVACGADRGAVELEGLPDLTRELVQVAGWDAAMTLLRAKGGTRLTFGFQAADAPWLVELVGTEAATALCRRFGTSRIDLPKYDSVELKIVRKRRHDLVLEMRAAGYRNNEIAFATGYCRRNVLLIAANRRSDTDAIDTHDELPARDPRQIDMFTDHPQAAGVAHDPFGLRARAAAET